MSESTTIGWDQDASGIVVLTLDDPNQSANTMNEAYMRSMAATVELLEAERENLSELGPSRRPGGVAGQVASDLELVSSFSRLLRERPGLSGCATSRSAT